MNLASESGAPIADWALEILACPNCRGGLTQKAAVVHCSGCGPAGRWERGIVRFGVPTADASIDWYKAKGGTNFQERSRVPFTMTSLDTPTYHALLEQFRPPDLDALVVDVGAGDGRNTEPWVNWGFRRVVAIDATIDSLHKLQGRLESGSEPWRERVLLVEADARRLPIRSGAAGRVLAVEALYYLNEDYEPGLTEAGRLLASAGRLFLSERAWEGALLTSLFQGGVGRLLNLRANCDYYDGSGTDLVRSRCFREEELLAIVERVGLRVIENRGLSVLSVVLGYLRGTGRISEDDIPLFPEVCEFLKELSATTRLRRTHVLTAARSERTEG